MKTATMLSIIAMLISVSAMSVSVFEACKLAGEASGRERQVSTYLKRAEGMMPVVLRDARVYLSVSGKPFMLAGLPLAIGGEYLRRIGSNCDLELFHQRDVAMIVNGVRIPEVFVVRTQYLCDAYGAKVLTM